MENSVLKELVKEYLSNQYEKFIRSFPLSEISKEEYIKENAIKVLDKAFNSKDSPEYYVLKLIDDEGN